MRLGIIGDIHADVRALEATLRHFEAMPVDRIVCVGDLIGYGAQPDDVVALVQERDILSIRGNHDRWAIERKQMIGLHGWKPAKLKDESWAYLETLPPGREEIFADRAVSIHHGSPASDTEFVTPYKQLPTSVTEHWGKTQAHVLLLGHTHIPMIDRSESGLMINAGSVHGVPGVQTSYSFGILDLDDLSVRIYDIRLGREIRRDPIYLDTEQ